MTAPKEIKRLVERFRENRDVYCSNEATDKQIDQLVYELYGLTNKEIRIVEEATK